MNQNGKRQPMAPVDIAWLRMESPANLMMIGGVLVLDDPLDMDRFRTVLNERLLTFDRFRQRVVDNGTQVFWEEDPWFHLDRHVHCVNLPSPGDVHALKALASDLMSTPLDRTHPLWQVHVVEQFDGGSVVIVRVHHCIADGIALVRVLLSLTDDHPDHRPAQPDRTVRPSHAWWEPARKLVEETFHIGQEVLEESRRILEHPGHLLELAQDGLALGSELARIAAMPADPKTRLKRPLAGLKQVSWAPPLALADVKATGKRLNATINDVLLTCAAGALRRYLIETGEDVTHAVLHAAVPVNLRPLDKPVRELGNQFGLVMVPLPVGQQDPMTRFEQVHNAMCELKRSFQAQLFYGLLGALGRGPAILEQTALEVLSKNASLVMSNVPGPQKPLYLAGSRLRHPLFLVPQSGEVGLGLSILTYDGQVLFGCIADRNLVPHPDRLVGHFETCFFELDRLTHGRP